jgi:hypothetical protein
MVKSLRNLSITLTCRKDNCSFTYIAQIHRPSQHRRQELPKIAEIWKEIAKNCEKVLFFTQVFLPLKHKVTKKIKSEILMRMRTLLTGVSKIRNELDTNEVEFFFRQDNRIRSNLVLPVCCSV